MNRTKLAAIGLGAILAIGSLAAPLTTLAAGNNIIVTPATTTISPAGSTGGTFTVAVVANSATDISGAASALNFDKTRLQLTALAKDSTEVANGVSYAGFPTASNTASFIASANAAGTIPTIAWTYTDGASFEAAGSNHGIFSATFQVIAAGNTSIDPVVVAGVGGLLDGTSANYGSSLSGISLTSGAVVNPTPTPTPTPGAPTPTPTPTPAPASAPPGSGTTTVSGSVDSGFLGLSVPSAVTIPLVRNATNNVNVPVTIYSNIIWNLQVGDPKTGATHGFMTDGIKVLANPMHVWQGTVPDPQYPSNTLPAYDANLSNPLPNTIGTGANSSVVTTTLAQFVASQDQPGSYGIQILYAAVSGF